jgi:hypothetical protein
LQVLQFQPLLLELSPRQASLLLLPQELSLPQPWPQEL